MNRCYCCQSIETISPGGEDTPSGWICRFCIDRMDGNAPVTHYDATQLKAAGLNPKQIKEAISLRFSKPPTLNQFKTNPEGSQRGSSVGQSERGQGQEVDSGH